MIHTFWPALLEQVPSADGASPEPPFLEQFITPVIKARRGTTLREFFSVRQFEAWREEGRIWAARQQPDSPPSASRATGVGERVFGEAAVGRWTVKYFKGLGTSSAAEGRGYFSALDRHRRPFVWGGAADGDRIDMAFSKDRADERKSWLGAGAADAAVVSSVIPPASDLPELPPDDSEPRASGNSKTADYFSTSTISFGDFVDRELIDFSRAVSFRGSLSAPFPSCSVISCVPPRTAL